MSRVDETRSARGQAAKVASSTKQRKQKEHLHHSMHIPPVWILDAIESLRKGRLTGSWLGLSASREGVPSIGFLTRSQSNGGNNNNKRVHHPRPTGRSLQHTATPCTLHPSFTAHWPGFIKHDDLSNARVIEQHTDGLPTMNEVLPHFFPVLWCNG